jgi:hypothetical protein
MYEYQLFSNRQLLLSVNGRMSNSINLFNQEAVAFVVHNNRVKRRSIQAQFGRSDDLHTRQLHHDDLV